MTESSPPHHPVDIEDDLAAALIAAQFPELADREIGRHYALEDHVSVRIGDDYGAIFPTVASEDRYYARAKALLEPHVDTWTFPHGAPLHTGTPSSDFPYHWFVVPWIAASTAAFVPLRTHSAQALGGALRQIHTKTASDAPDNPRASHSLSELEDQWISLVADVLTIASEEARIFDANLAQRLWREAKSGEHTPQRTWTHGNLNPRAVLSDQGTFAGILLWQYFGAGNPAIDLGAASVLVSTQAQDALLKAYGKVNRSLRASIRGFELLTAMRYIASGESFRAQLAWERLTELEVAG